jgi:hypothetical protein
MTRLQAWLSGLVLAVCVLSHDASAQQTGVTGAGIDSLKKAVGFRVRVMDTESSSWQTGTLGAVNNETLTLHGREDEKIRTANLVAVQRSLGRARYNPTMAGFFIGLTAGGIIGYSIGNNSYRHSRASNASQRSVGLAIGGAVGAGLGALIGAAVAPEHWRDIRLR